jgi:hypothetical protein
MQGGCTRCTSAETSRPPLCIEARPAPASDWKQGIREAYAAHAETRPRFAAGASEASLCRLAARLGRPVPAELADLLRASDGVAEESRGVNGSWNVSARYLLTVAEIEEEAKTAVEPPDSVYVFGRAHMDGVMFGFDRSRHPSAVFAWYPMEGELVRVADSLEAFLRGWLGGTLSI